MPLSSASSMRIKMSVQPLAFHHSTDPLYPGPERLRAVNNLDKKNEECFSIVLALEVDIPKQTDILRASSHLIHYC